MTDALAVGMSKLTTALLSIADLTDSLAPVSDILSRMLPGHPIVVVRLAFGDERLIGVSYDGRTQLVGHTSLGYSHPLTVGGEHIGAIEVHRNDSDAADEPLREAVALAADHMSVLITVALDNLRQTRLTDQLRGALASRSTIDQALGILMERNRCSRDAAFDTLRNASQQHNTKVAELAASLIETVTGAQPAATHFNEPEPTVRLNRANRGK
ncbi:ANTAR domain-containing protein [Nocardia sp. NPDC088792]|uniref:ANTAR domain-containing protein n=1 Tax=Nocardia sp. NPDC088792 TaxID=3364332 RepID=UPI0038254E15